MAVTQEFMEAVQSGREMRVRIMLKDSLLVDPTSAQFDEMERYAAGQMGSLYMQHDGEQLNFDVATWDEDYLNRQMVAVVGNFSRERVELLRAMVQHLYRDKANKIREDRNYAASKSGMSRKQIGTGVTAAGAALTVAGLCTSHTMLVVGGVVVATAGVALIVSDRGDS